MQESLDIDVDTLNSWLGRDDVAVLDVRTDEEFAYDHIQELHIPLQDLPHKLSTLDQDKIYACLCLSGVRSFQAATILRQAGIEAYNIKGGAKAWKAQIDPSFNLG